MEELPNEKLMALRARLKSGEYDGTDIMSAWLALDDAARYHWLVGNAVIETESWRHDGKDPASTKQPLDNAIDAAIRKAP